MTWFAWSRARPYGIGASGPGIAVAILAGYRVELRARAPRIDQDTGRAPVERKGGEQTGTARARTGQSRSSLVQSLTHSLSLALSETHTHTHAHTNDDVAGGCTVTNVGGVVLLT